MKMMTICFHRGGGVGAALNDSTEDASSNQPSYRSAASFQAARFAACIARGSATSAGVAGRTFGVSAGSGTVTSLVAVPSDS